MNQRIGYVNSDDAVRWWCTRHNIDDSMPPPFTDPDVTERMEREYLIAMDIDWSYGGWMEDRSTLWRGTYLEKDQLWLHLGIDLAVPAGTEVKAVCDGPIVYCGDDTPDVGGWGRHAIQKVWYCGQVHALIYAHLARQLLCKRSDMKKGRPIGHIGTKAENGYWSPHLHLQLWGCDITEVTDWKKFLEEHDGYGKLEERGRWVNICPDPTPLIFG